MEKDGKWRFTSPTHTVLAFAKALKELEAEGGIAKRAARYRENNRILIERFQSMGMQPYIDGAHQGPVITTFCIRQIQILRSVRCIIISKSVGMRSIRGR